MSKACLLVICLLVTPFTGCIVENDSTDEQSQWNSEGALMVWGVEGSFAPDPNQDEGPFIDAVQNMFEDPLGFQESAHNLSWKEYNHNFIIESEWESNFIILLLSVDYTYNETEPSEGIAGTLNLSIMDPNGGEYADGYEVVTWSNKIDERTYVLPPIDGVWTITISGSGLDGIGSLLYSGDYLITVEADITDTDGAYSS